MYMTVLYDGSQVRCDCGNEGLSASYNPGWSVAEIPNQVTESDVSQIKIGGSNDNLEW